MTKKTVLATASPPSMPISHLLWIGWKLVIAVSLTLCFLAFLRLQRYSPYDSSHSLSLSTSHALIRNNVRSRVFPDNYRGNPKIAFMFLARRNLPLDFLWGSFFENAEVRNFSIFIHPEPGFVFNESTTRSPFFYNRQLKNSIKVAWGESSMIEAERLLLEVALEDPANQRFVLLSDSCAPLYNFSFLYNYLMASPRSFVDSFLDKKEDRYNPKMSPFIPKKSWRKGSQLRMHSNVFHMQKNYKLHKDMLKWIPHHQLNATLEQEWISLIRKHAEVVVDDKLVFLVFKKFCKRRPPVDPRKGKKNLKLQKQHNCIPDEHYVQTLLAMSDLEGELERRTVTYSSWNQSMTNVETKGWHPFTFSYADAGPQQIKRIKDINHVYYDTEYRTEWCSNNARLVPCFLFARKLSQGAAMRLLSTGIVGRFTASALLELPP